VRLAVIGGSFNPVHTGHLALADEVRCALGYDRIVLIPAASPPHKALSGDASAEDRLAMLELAAAGVPWLSVDSCELDRGGVSWTIDTLEYLQSVFRDIEGKVGLVIGADLAPGFTKWRRAGEIARIADIVLARRPPDSPDRGAGAATRDFPYPCVFLENDPLPISSSGIRRRIAEGKSWRYLVPEPVYGYIEGHGLYDTRRT